MCFGFDEYADLYCVLPNDKSKNNDLKSIFK